MVNRENLQKLATYLKGDLLADFDMRHFSDTAGVTPINCGTIGCALGHGSYAGINKISDESWLEYGNRAFGLSYKSDTWGWMFGCGWAITDNSPLGAAARIEYYLNSGLPNNWRQQMLGEAPLCYTVK